MKLPPTAGKNAVSYRRRRQVTDEHLPIDPEVLGTELAAPWRRGAAMAIDFGLSTIWVLAWAAGWALMGLHLQAPKFIPTMAIVLDAEAPKDQRDQAVAEMWPELVGLVAKRRPDLLPPEAHQAIEEGDGEFLGNLARTSSLDLNFGSTDLSRYDRESDTYHLTGEIIFGPFARVAAGFSGMLLYFTLFMRWMRGRTPGKWLLGIRVRRLDGRPLSLWDAFGRVGGYSASLSTFGLGFLEVFWHPNRQAIHDRISGTVVVRQGRFGPRVSLAEAGAPTSEDTAGPEVVASEDSEESIDPKLDSPVESEASEARPAPNPDRVLDPTDMPED